MIWVCALVCGCVAIYIILRGPLGLGHPKRPTVAPTPRLSTREEAMLSIQERLEHRLPLDVDMGETKLLCSGDNLYEAVRKALLQGR